jgi:hypothetical protein
MITDLCERDPLTASARKTSLIDKPPRARPPIFRNPRRETRSQNRPPPELPKIVSIAMRNSEVEVRSAGSRNRRV